MKAQKASLLAALVSILSFTSFSQTTHTIEYNNLDPIKFKDEYVLVGDSVVVINKTSYIGNIYYELNGGTPVQSDGVDMNDTIYSFLVDESLEKLRVTIDGKSSLNVTFHKVGTVSIDNLNDLDFSVYPNPTSDVLNIKGDNIESVKVFDMNGQLVPSDVVSTTNISLNVSTLTNGYYTVLINDVKQIKFIKN